MQIVITKDEKHPIESRVIEQGNSQRVVKVFGLARHRGDNIVYSTRVTDPYYDILKKYTLQNYNVEPTSKFTPTDAKAKMEEAFGGRFDFIGIAYNIRTTMNAEQYETFIKELCDAIE